MKKGNMKEEPRKVRTIILNLIRVLLLVAFVGAIYNERKLIVFISLLAFVLTFLPLIFKRAFDIELPAGFEVIVILFIYGALFFGRVNGFSNDFWWWGIFLNLVLATAFGFMGLAVMYSLYKGDKIHGSPLIIAVFAFCFAVAAGTVWEFFEFFVDGVFGFNLQQTSNTMVDLVANMIGALVISSAGYFYIKNGKVVLISGLVSKFIERNPRIFGTVKKVPSEEVISLIENGEHEKVEFKSTLRTNLHTSQVDKRMEHAVLKTVAAYMNSEGGTLLIGVGDDKEILGMDKDNFPNNDKASLHLNSLIRDNLGGEYLPFVKAEIVLIDSKSVLKINCKKSDMEVFLKNGNEEEFYVRNGPSSVKLNGRALLGYINRQFGKKD
jgi:hypothetical protein